MAGCSVEAGGGDLQALDGAVTEDVRLDDLVNVVEGDAAVPDGVGIDDDGGAVFALVEASGLVGTNYSAVGRSCKVRFEGTVKIAGSGRVAATTRMTCGPLISANEDVLGEFRHERLCARSVEIYNKNGPHAAARTYSNE